MDYSDSYKPCIPRNVSVRRNGEHFLLIDPETPNWISSSALGALILACCNGQTSIADLTRIVVETQKISHEKARTKVIELIARVDKASFAADLEAVRDTDDQGNYLFVDLNLTNKCNLRCPYCYADAGSSNEPEMGKDEIIRLLDRLVGLRPAKIAFTGGEPLLRKDLFEIARHGAELGFKMILITNGTLLDKCAAAQIAEYFEEVQVSLDGSTAAIHESLRGANTFSKTVNACRLLIEAKANISISTTLTSLNLQNLPDMARRVNDMGVKSFHVTRFVPWGRGAKHPDLLPDVDQCIDMVNDLDEQLAGTVTFNPFLACRPVRLNKKRSCGIGKHYFSIRANGDVYPCYSIRRPDLCAGNVRMHDVVDLYRNSTAFKRCRDITVDAIESCKECSWRYLCGGGCRGVALVMNGALNAGLTQYECEFQRKIIEHSLWDPVGAGEQVLSSAEKNKA